MVENGPVDVVLDMVVSEFLPTISQGDSGHSVAVLQTLLNLVGEELRVSGDYDLDTFKAVSRIQRRQSLLSPSVGVCDTWFWVWLFMGEE
jgi:hypothetical protein